MNEFVIGYTVYKKLEIGTVKGIENWLPEVDDEESKEYRDDALNDLEHEILKGFPEGSEIEFDIVSSDAFAQIQIARQEE